MSRSLIEQFGYWPLDKRRQLESHRNSGLEIVLVMRGHLTWHVEGHVETVSPGSVFFTLPWETHGSVHEREAGCELFFAVVKLDRPYRHFSKSFRFAKSLGMNQSALRSLRESLLSAPKRSWPAPGRLAKLFPELIEELSRPANSTDAIAALVRLLLIELQRSIAGQAFAPTPAPSLQRVHSFVDRLVNECHRPWTLSSMAGACNLGRSRFTALLEQVTARHPHDGTQPRPRGPRPDLAAHHRLAGDPHRHGLRLRQFPVFRRRFQSLRGHHRPAISPETK